MSLLQEVSAIRTIYEGVGVISAIVNKLDFFRPFKAKTLRLEYSIR